MSSRFLPPLLCLCLSLSLSATAGGATGETGHVQPDECAKIDDNAVRLRCYDERSGRICGGRFGIQPVEDVEWTRSCDMADSHSGRTGSTMSSPIPSMPRRARRPRRGLVPRRASSTRRVRFQISFKTKLWQDVLGRDMDLWLAYTQLSFWQFYDFENSAPFRETDYEPELFSTSERTTTSWDSGVVSSTSLQSPIQRPIRAAFQELEPRGGEFRIRTGQLRCHPEYLVPHSREERDDDNPEWGVSWGTDRSTFIIIAMGTWSASS